MKIYLMLFLAFTTVCFAQMTVRNSDNQIVMVVTDAGHMGIGTTNPEEKLVVNGVIQVKSGAPSANNQNHAGYTFDVEDDGGLYLSAPDMLTLAANGEHRLNLKSDGKVGVWTTNPSTMLVIGDNLGDWPEIDGPVIGTASDFPMLVAGKNSDNFARVEWYPPSKTLVMQSKNSGLFHYNTLVVKDGAVGVNTEPAAGTQLHVNNGTVRVNGLAGPGTRQIMASPDGKLTPGNTASGTDVKIIATMTTPMAAGKVPTPVTGWDLAHDPDGLFDPATDTWIIQNSGWYMIYAKCEYVIQSIQDDLEYAAATMEINWGIPVPTPIGVGGEIIDVYPNTEFKSMRAYYGRETIVRPWAIANAYLNAGDKIQIAVYDKKCISTDPLPLKSARLHVEYLGESS